MRPVLLAAAAALLAACVTPRVAVNPRANFAAVQRVAVVTFGGPQGDLAADMMTQGLVAHGADVVERQQLSAILQEQHLATSGILDPATVQQVGKILGVDALFVGTVAQSKESQSYVVTQPRHAVTGGVTPVGGRTVVSEGSVLGVPNSQIVTTEAGAALVARMVDVKTGSVLWSASMSYEGFDVQSAMQSITDAFVQSLLPVWPQLIGK